MYVVDKDEQPNVKIIRSAEEQHKSLIETQGLPEDSEMPVSIKQNMMTKLRSATLLSSKQRSLIKAMLDPERTPKLISFDLAFRKVHSCKYV